MLERTMFTHNNDPNTNTRTTIQIVIALVIAILITAQTILVYIILSQQRETVDFARPQACDNFELKSPDERAKCRPVNYLPKNYIEA